MKLEKIGKNAYHIIGNNAKELAMAFVRIQEFYESPKFSGKIFSLKEFKKWWKANPPKGIKRGRFCYANYYEGFNVPSSVIKPFLEGKFNPLSKFEKKLLKLVSGIKDKDFYLIGTRKNGKIEHLKHEIAHGLYHNPTRYQKKVRTILRRLSPKTRIKIDRYLKGMDYHPKVLADERQAYIVAGGNDLAEAKITLDEIENVRQPLTVVYKNALLNSMFKRVSSGLIEN
jgi:hypothetical protein